MAHICTSLWPTQVNIHHGGGQFFWLELIRTVECSTWFSRSSYQFYAFSGCKRRKERKWVRRRDGVLIITYVLGGPHMGLWGAHSGSRRLWIQHAKNNSRDNASNVNVTAVTVTFVTGSKDCRNRDNSQINESGMLTLRYTRRHRDKTQQRQQSRLRDNCRSSICTRMSPFFSALWIQWGCSPNEYSLLKCSAHVKQRLGTGGCPNVDHRMGKTMSCCVVRRTKVAATCRCRPFAECSR